MKGFSEAWKKQEKESKNELVRRQGRTKGTRCMICAKTENRTIRYPTPRPRQGSWWKIGAAL